MKKVKIGVFGGVRGENMVDYCKISSNAQIVAICDFSVNLLQKLKINTCGYDIGFYDNFDDFIKHNMDAIVIANYATEHAPYAIKAMKRGLHVFSEVLPVQTMKEAVELIETVEETGMIYAYNENYCYMSATYEMKKLYEKGKIGKFEYGEGEYIHNCEPNWHNLTGGDETHWRNNMYSTFYCTHSIGPLVHITGLRPISVIGLEGVNNERNLRTGAKGGAFGIEMVTLNNGGIIKSIHGGLYINSIWYSIYGSKGRMESAREDANSGNYNHLHVKFDIISGVYDVHEESYNPVREFDDISDKFPHGNSDYYSMWNFTEKVLGNTNADIIDVFEALDMFLPGLFAYRSILSGGISVKIPDLRDKSIRDKWRNDTLCIDPNVAQEQLLPTFSKGTPNIDKGIYQLMKNRYENK